ncbi:MAG: AAA family ATPase [Desulfovibrio sp.]|jgi:uncharacterized protein YhaN|nr:AAA family ATPase [Desulfovibrio sp.]
MYIESFHIVGFGVFSGVTVEALSPGFSIFLGENETGKSTCLEFLRATLAGYPSKHGKAWKPYVGYLQGGKTGGSLVLRLHSGEKLHLTRRSGGVPTIADDAGRILPTERFNDLLRGVNRDVYNAVFGFSLSELQTFESLNAPGVSDALYSASFGPGLISPSAVLTGLNKEMENIFKPNGFKPALNADLKDLEDIRRALKERRRQAAAHNDLACQLDLKKSNLEELRKKKADLEAEQSRLARRLGVWSQWEERHKALARLERLETVKEDFPEDVPACLAALKAERQNCERQLAERRGKKAELEQRYRIIIIDVNPTLLEAMPLLRSLDGRKNAYVEALAILPAQKEECRHAAAQLKSELACLGRGWTCARIRATDRTFFAREDIEKQAREMTAANLARNAALVALQKAEQETSSSREELESAKQAMDLLPAPQTALDGDDRDTIRQALRRREENLRQLAECQSVITKKRAAFVRAFEPLGIKATDPAKFLEAALTRREEALCTAGEVQDKQHEAEKFEDAVRQVEVDVQGMNMRKKLLQEGFQRDPVVGSRKILIPPSSVKSLPLTILGLVLILFGAGMLLAHWHLGITSYDLTEQLVVPITLWSGYLILVCGVAFLTCGLPRNGPEAKRHKQRMAQLIEDLNREIKMAEVRLKKAVERLDQQKSCVQQVLRHWQEIRRYLGIGVVPTADGAGAFFARAETARVSLAALQEADTALRDLEADTRAQEDSLRALQPVAALAENPENGESLAQSARRILENCKAADATLEERIKAEAALKSKADTLESARRRREEETDFLQKAEGRLNDAQIQWQTILGSLGLGISLTPVAVREAFNCMDKCLAAEDRLQRYVAERKRSRLAAQALRKPLAALLEKLDRLPLTDQDGGDDWPGSLDEVLQAAEKAVAGAVESDSLTGQLTEAQEFLQREQAALNNALKREAELFARAGACDANDLLRLDRVRNERFELARLVQQNEDMLRLAAGAEPFENFFRSFREADQEALHSGSRDIKAKLDSMQTEESILNTSVMEKQAHVKALEECADDLIKLQQQEASLVESMEEKGREWAKLAIARELLTRAKIKFEQKRQPGVIRSASKIFADITNLWGGIRASLDDASLSILPIHDAVAPVAPDVLSRGAQEQAYLSLRLAYIANHTSEAEPLPVIMDEILVNFDPVRAERTACALADMAEGSAGNRHQLLYFTCQPHIVEMLRGIAPQATLFSVRDGGIHRV